MLAVESGVPAYVVGVRRSGIGRYRGRLAPVAGPGGRAPAASGSTGTMTALAASFERIIEDAPEQWWAVFFPIWPDLEDAA